MQLSDFHHAENWKQFHAEKSVKKSFLHYFISLVFQNIKNGEKISISPWSSMCLIAVSTLRLVLGITPQLLMRYLRVLNMHFITKPTFLLLLLWCFPGTIIWSSNYHNFILVWVINKMYQCSLCEMLHSVFNFSTYLRPLRQGPGAVVARPSFDGGWDSDRHNLWGTLRDYCPQLAIHQRSPSWAIFSGTETDASLNLRYLAPNSVSWSQGASARVARDSNIC